MVETFGMLMGIIILCQAAVVHLDILYPCSDMATKGFIPGMQALNLFISHGALQVVMHNP
jgi:hypothetical protein